MPYPGQIPGIGAPGTPGDFTAGVDMGWGPPPAGFPEGLWIDLTPTQTTPPAVPSVAPPTAAPIADPSVPVAQPPSSEPPIEGTIVGPDIPIHDYEGYDQLPGPDPDWKPGRTIEGEVIPPAGESEHGPSSWSILERIAGGLVGRVIGRVVEGPWGTVIEEVITPEALPSEPDVRGIPSPIQFPTPSAPRPVSSNPAGPATPRAPRAPRPPLPPVPQLPSMSVPKPDIGASTWPSYSPAPTPATPPSSPSALPLPSPTTTTAPQPVTSSQPGPQSSAQPASSATPSKQWQFDPLPAWLADAIAARSPTRAPQPMTPPTLQQTSAPQPVSVTAPQPVSAPSTATGSVAPPLTPIRPAAVESPPDGPACETGPQRKARQRRQRESCERFITITIPRHKRRVCAAEAGKYIGRKLGKALGRAVGRTLRGKPFLGEPKKAGKRKGARRKEEPLISVGRRGHSIELPGGVGIEIPKQMRPKGLPRVPRL